MCICVYNYTLSKVVSHYDLSVLSMKKNLDRQWGELYPFVVVGFLEFV